MYTNRTVPLLFPIIKPECVSVDSVTAVSDSAGCITVDWEPQPVVQRRWFVHFSDGDSSGFSEIADTCHLRRCGLPPGTTYTVSIQGQCRDLLEDQYYSPWSDSVTVTVMAPDSTSATDSTGIDPGTDTTGVDPGIDSTGTGGDTTDVGIRRAVLPEVTLTPNPARGTVTVASGAQLLRIEVYDPQGRLLRTVAADGTATTLDLAALPPAVYTLIIHTAAGAQTRKLTVAR